MKMNNKDKQYIYIVQSSSEKTKCKIGKTKDLEQRLKTYNTNKTGNSADAAVTFQYLFTCEVADMTQVENDIKKEFKEDREINSREIYFYNSAKFEKYVSFIKSHKLFIKEIFVRTEPKPTIKEIIVRKTTPSLDKRELSPKDIMQLAKRTKNDEFYTRYEDIEKEIGMYDKSIWKDKVVFCNCDDAVDDDERKTSAFVQYFKNNFTELGIKKLICTHYSSPVDLFQQGSKAYVAYIYIFTDGGLKIEKIPIKDYDGSFDHPISLKILNEEADIVCTNPPFSRARDYWRVVIESGKKFLIISNFTNALNTAYILYFINKQVWPGYNRVDWFLTPKRIETNAAGHWYTNLPVKDRPKYKNLKIMPLKKIPEKYKKFDDSKMLVVDNNYIPSNYKKPFAVSVYPILSGILEKGYKYVQDKEYVPYINGKRQFGRVLIQKI